MKDSREKKVEKEEGGEGEGGRGHRWIKWWSATQRAVAATHMGRPATPNPNADDTAA